MTATVNDTLAWPPSALSLIEEQRVIIGGLHAALKVAAQWVPLPNQAYTPDARRDAEIVQAALTLPSGLREVEDVNK